VIGARQPRESWWPAYCASRDAGLVASALACAAFLPPVVIAMSVLMVWLQPATLERWLWLGGVYVALCTAAGVLWLAGVAARRAVPYACLSRSTRHRLGSRTVRKPRACIGVAAADHQPETAFKHI
jgi:uncharacterized membrane protein